MSSLARPTGPLPSSVYWRRRILALSVALLLMLGLGKVLSLSSDGSSGEQAATVAETPAAGPTSGAPTTPSTPAATRTKKTKTPLAEPEGPCDPTDVIIEPRVKQVPASDAMTLKMFARTKASPACTFDFNRTSVTVKITSGKDLIWTSVECGHQLERRQLVLRNTEDTRVDFVWSGRRSDTGCPRDTDWALPGYYHLSASALGGEPSEDQWELRPPKTVYVTETAKPKKGKKKAKRD